MIDGPDSFRAAYGVSRETTARLETLAALLQKWNRRINLVSSSTIPVLWSRHIADSAQLWPLRQQDEGLWLDLGSGAGFPGLVVAMLAAEFAPAMVVRLVESDERKAAFLSTVARETGLAVDVLTTRIERLAPQQADVVSARALAPLADLIGMVEKHRRPGGIGLFPKGETVHNEIADASSRWRFDCKLIPSRTDPRATILEIGATERV